MRSARQHPLIMLPALALAACSLLWSSAAAIGAEKAALTIAIREAGAAVPARVHLTGPDGKPVEAPGLPFFSDHFDCLGDVRLELAPGRYQYAVERGPEYGRVQAEVELEPGKERQITVQLERIADLARRGWWSGELHVHRPVADMPVLLQAEDLHFAPVLTVWNQGNHWQGKEIPAQHVVRVGKDRAYDILGCEDERRGGAILYYRLERPLDFRGDGPEYPSTLANLQRARAAGGWIDIEKPFWWDVPFWITSGRIDSIGIANNHMCRTTMYADEAWGRPRDVRRLPAPRGNGFWSQEIYYRILDCGFRIAPSAGSASGVLPNPVGYNRVYVHLDGEFSPAAWWKGLAAGRSFVTNGPLLLVKARGELPGATFRFDAGAALEVPIEVELAGNDPLEALEVVVNGRIVQRIESPPRTGRLRVEPLRFDQSGWFLIRAITTVPHTFRFASTAPFWVEREGSRRRVDPEDIEFFIAWIRECIERIERDAPETIGDPTDPENARKLESVLAPHRKAMAAFESLRTATGGKR